MDVPAADPRWGSPPPVVGRRERKKAATRTAIADAALDLFLDRGYRDVSIKQIAEHADVAVTTVFKHFDGKVALVFDRDHDIEREITAAVATRPAGSPVLDALERYLLTTPAAVPAQNERYRRFRDLILTTPELDRYWRAMWMRHADALAAALSSEASRMDAPLSEPAALALATGALSAVDIARHQPDPAAAIRDVFDLLRSGWAH